MMKGSMERGEQLVKWWMIEREREDDDLKKKKKWIHQKVFSPQRSNTYEFQCRNHRQ